MFEGIRFNEAHVEEPLTHENYARTITGFFGKGNEGMREQYAFSARGEFCIDGPNRTSVHHLVSRHAQERYFYMQSFTIHESGPRYYTHRSGMPSCLLCLTLKGAARLEYGGRSYELSEGLAFLIDCREEHRYEAMGAQWHHADLHVDGAWTADHIARIHSARGVVFPFEDEQLSHVAKLLRADQELGAERELKVSSLIDGLFDALATDAEHSHVALVPEEVSSVVDFLEAHYAEHIDLDELAALAHMSKATLVRQFRRYLGKTPIDYLIDVRLAAARDLLVITDLPVARVAEAVGIPSAPYFSRLFKMRIGIAPHLARGKD